ncbi:MAG: hypothetical protein IVW55_12030 [Chloroflexi bacterium]|nr:hypothetical protein [Chloroflexota bacterium]
MTMVTAGSDDEENLLASFADLDDEEALTVAIRRASQLAIATDNRNALGLFCRVRHTLS